MNKISFKHTLTIGLMLFALFFGAGNLVFPAMLGQQAGDQFGLAALGFLVTGVGLPLLGIIAFGFSGTKDLLSLTNRVHPIFAIVYTTLLYLSIGPLFAMPRTGTVSYEIALKPLLASGNEDIALIIYSVLFFGLTLLFSINPARMIDLVGQVLTPALLLLIAVLAAAALLYPLGNAQDPVGDYTAHAFFNGFQEGYLTMDTLAAFVFGIIVIDAIKARGASDNRRSLLLTCLQAGLVSATILAAIYVAITFIGATSVSSFGRLANGGEVLSVVADYYFGTFGGAVLGVIVLLACLTTSIGLTTSCSSYFHQLMPFIPYKGCCILMCAVSTLIANIGLTQLISFSVPVLTILYPLAIVLIALTFCHDLFKGRRSVYMFSLLFTFLISLVYGLAGTPLNIFYVHDWLYHTLPLYDLGVGWVLPALSGALIGLVASRQ